MAETSPINGKEIVQRLGESGVHKALRLIGLTNLLRDSIITDSYTPSERLFQSIRLTTRGQSVARKISIENPNRQKSSSQRGQSVKYPRESQLMCLLELGNGEPLIDLSEIEIEDVRSAISEEVKAKAVLHPYIFGGTLYNRAAGLFLDRQPDLSYQQTIDLLDGTEQGVFQAREWLTGPFGVYQVREKRSLAPITRIPLQHCHDISCSAVHDTWLRTSRVAAINSRRELIKRHLSSDANNPEWEWIEAFKLVTEEDPRFYRDDVKANVLPLIGDGLSLQEKRKLLCSLIDTNQQGFREFGEHRNGMRGAAGYADSLSEAECLQEILWFDDATISRVLDQLILGSPEVIRIPPGEVRRTVLVNPDGYGYYRTTTELSRHGLRIVGPQDIAPLRLDRAIEAIYATEPDQADLGWKLRQYRGASVTDKISEALREGELLELIETLLADSMHHALKACAAVGLETEHVNQSDLPELLAWKIGFDVPLRGDIFAQFEKESRRFQDAIASQTSDFDLREVEVAPFDQAGAIRKSRGMREAGSSYFVMLEHALRELVGFSTWALLSNHFGDMAPFQYDSREALSFAAHELNPLLAPDSALDAERPTLNPLIAAVGALSHKLDPSSEGTVGAQLPKEYVPEVAEKSDLVRFPFATTSLFDALSAESREVIHHLLDEAHGSLVGSGIAGLRNGQLHYRPNSAASAELSKGVDQVMGVMRTLDKAGLMPALSSLIEVKSGRWGRRTYVHAVDNRRRSELHSPTAVFSGLFPSRWDDQLIIPQARLGLDSSPLRFALRSSSEYADMWSGVPNRRRRSIAEASAVEGIGLGEGARGI